MVYTFWHVGLFFTDGEATEGITTLLPISNCRRECNPLVSLTKKAINLLLMKTPLVLG
jgi:hypothetical protein